MSNLKDYATGTVAAAPSPATTGTSLDLQTGEGDRMPATPFMATAHPPGVVPTLDNAEKIEVTDVTDDTLTIVREQGDTTAKSIALGWRITNAVFSDDLDPVQQLSGATIPSATANQGDKILAQDASDSDALVYLTLGNLAMAFSDDSIPLGKLAYQSGPHFIGRSSGGTGAAAALSASSARSVLNVEDGADVTDATNVAAAGAFMKSSDDLDDITEGTTNKHFTSTEKNKLSNVEANADVTDAGNVGSSIHGASAKSTPVDADTVALIDSEASNVLKKLSWANIKATIKSYYDSVAATLTNKSISGSTNTLTNIGTSALSAGAVTQRSMDQDASSDTTTSSSYSNLDTKTITTNGGDVLVLWTGESFASSNPCSIHFIVTVDGVLNSIDPLFNVNHVTPLEVKPMTIVHLVTGLSAASHTFRVRFKRNGGSGTGNARNFSFTLIELKR